MKRITTAMMADALGVPVQTIRVGLQQKVFDFGIAMQQSGRKYTYVIFPEKARQCVPAEIYKQWGIAE